MKRIIKLLIAIFVISMAFLGLDSNHVSAKEAVASKTVSDIFGEPIGTIKIYSDGEIEIGYKFGLRKATLYYCSKDDCDINHYSSVLMVESSASNTYKNEEDTLASYSYRASFSNKGEYSLRVEVYFGTNRGYSGVESIDSFTVGQVEVLDMGNYYINVSASSDYGDEGLNSLMEKMTMIVNTIVLPIIYTLISALLVIKGAILGVQIVKNADMPEVRSEKIRALKWLVIGIAIAFLASSAVGVVTGFFKNLF